MNIEYESNELKLQHHSMMFSLSSVTVYGNAKYFDTKFNGDTTQLSNQLVEVSSPKAN